MLASRRQVTSAGAINSIISSSPSRPGSRRSAQLTLGRQQGFDVVLEERLIGLDAGEGLHPLGEHHGASARELGETLRSIVTDPGRGERMIERAREVLATNRGAIERSLRIVLDAYDRSDERDIEARS